MVCRARRDPAAAWIRPSPPRSRHMDNPNRCGGGPFAEPNKGGERHASAAQGRCSHAPPTRRAPRRGEGPQASPRVHPLTGSLAAALGRRNGGAQRGSVAAPSSRESASACCRMPSGRSGRADGLGIHRFCEHRPTVVSRRGTDGHWTSSPRRHILQRLRELGPEEEGPDDPRSRPGCGRTCRRWPPNDGHRGPRGR